MMVANETTINTGPTDIDVINLYERKEMWYDCQ